jgi:hypothetical protein
VDLLDLAPTIADVFGVLGQGGSDKQFQGRSLLPVLEGAPGKPAVLSRTVWDRPRYSLRDERFKFIYDTRTGEEQLFDLQTDPGETRDVAAGGSRCGPRTSARPCTNGSWAWAGAAAVEEGPSPRSSARTFARWAISSAAEAPSLTIANGIRKRECGHEGQAWPGRQVRSRAAHARVVRRRRASTGPAVAIRVAEAQKDRIQGRSVAWWTSAGTGWSCASWVRQRSPTRREH